ncbi:MAG: Acyl-phosphate:glycerol-3-phosphate O-acyltransferase PlsY [uncultured Thermomicrobiales bacterium]|uniref:Glycerol-3-phosphate acyltransferase n=1 Tax=uncultured Thermomicrobiales bacterium TaxID=1645740 RepID=A0A6J4UL08_9BACT|nr:MAG: Acyl-phosphate:glycerol-3-phosphate O-acyltransferase PlsY [uncultured Thermomicrobiales bacterium]
MGSGGVLLGALLVVIGYGLGCLSAGYYLVRLRTGGDVRAGGSGGLGATNVGRVLGRRGFVLVFLMDLAKGALATALAVWAGVGEVGIALTALAVTAGHVWPAQLGFRGGRGVATAWGAALVVMPWVALSALGVAIVVWVGLRRVTRSGLVGIAACPVLSAAFGRTMVETLGIAALAAVVLVAHRDHLRAWVGQPAVARPAAQVRGGRS